MENWYVFVRHENTSIDCQPKIDDILSGFVLHWNINTVGICYLHVFPKSSFFFHQFENLSLSLVSSVQMNGK